MKKFFVVLAAMMMIGSVSPAFAEIEVSGDAYVSINSMYLWRGFDLSADDSFVAQPGADVSFGGFSLGWWGNMSENTGEMNEVDLVLDYSFDLGELVSMSIGNILYDVDGFKTTNELYLGVSLNTVLEPSLTIYYDYDECEETGAFYTFSVGHGFDLAENIGLGIGALVSYNQESDFAVGNYSDLHNAELSLGLDYSVTDQIVVSPAVIYSTPMSDDAEDISGIDDEFMGGVTVALNF
ncbi:hypothetical protein [Desulfuromonas sp.]|uniref:hypothetical protein n=1 Tax=Desulfuromonas sp. TaxID=892 RepID=UPI0025BF159C|nr:hypothetical protein [Desulfuromonas sp.]